ncbi:type I methionyl aminopeptidase [Ancrocorticia populi]|uniref:Methionine aminopeptidase n=1 Tax=Ancrocorticia populi TaxID=2175228 RepID=A0A2V1K8M4_9ACTO|nr:type I methionyl aminopeptidase [Ancrocorticia populi]PWF27473.1 type I methionyl aminopeptidase [Ancrocorticia populi]
MSRKEKIQYKSHEQFLKMRQAGLVVADIHRALREKVRAGRTTADADAIAAEVLERAGSKSNFLGYYGYPGHICTSVNEVIVHGIPGDRVLEPGDLVSFDCGAVVDGWHGDAAISMVIPGGDPELTARRQRLSDMTEECMWRGIAAAATGSHVGDIGRAIDDFVVGLQEEPGIVEEYVGHGIGTAMHMAPDVPNYRTRSHLDKLKPGMALCIEPMLTSGSPENVTLGDDWTVVTLDGGDACHWEHEIAIHERGIWVLTAPDGGIEGLSPYGVVPVPLG